MDYCTFYWHREPFQGGEMYLYRHADQHGQIRTLAEVQVEYEPGTFTPERIMAYCNGDEAGPFESGRAAQEWVEAHFHKGD